MKITEITQKESEELGISIEDFKLLQEEFFWQKMVELFHTPEEAT
jgi:hypothetical protein